MKKKLILVTGCAGFIGYHLSLSLLEKKYSVIGIDSIDSYYSGKLKKDRISELKKYSKKKHMYFQFLRMDIKNSKKLNSLFSKYKFKEVIHLAAQAGVRYSLINPKKYLDTNIVGYFNILECCRKHKVNKIIFASSSSVYGNLKKNKFKETDLTDSPIQFYAATKKSNEVMSYAYSSLYNLNITGIRFFTVYGPWGRPDMSIFKFTKNIIENKKINIFNNGKHKRDFTYIDDVTLVLMKLLNRKRKKNEKKFNIFNIGNGKPEKLIYLIQCLENILGKKAKKNFLGLQKGDVEKTHSDISNLKKYISLKPRTDLKYGLRKFISWYKSYYKV